MSTQQEITILKDVELVVTIIGYLVSILFLLHFYVFKRTQYKEIMSKHLVKLVMLLIFTGLIKNIFGLPSSYTTILSACTTLISLTKTFAMAEQLYSFMIALDLCITSFRPLAIKKFDKYLNIVTHPTIWIISIVIGIMNGISYYQPDSACVIQKTPLLVKIASFFFVIVFLINMLLFIMFFIKSRQLFGKIDSQLISKKQEVILYILMFITFGFLRAPLYIYLIITYEIIKLYIFVNLNLISAILVPVIFAWNFGLFRDYKNWIMHLCFKEKKIKIDNNENDNNNIEQQ